ncbi:MAG: hypothetical protein K2K93_08515 [Muribaculaceae bacterium]|nr:hypothetical protein [Muribaculaceae bacterium]
MKNIIKTLFMAVVMACTLTACRDNAEIPDHGPVVHPQEDAKGLYVGEWTIEEVGSPDVKTEPGTMELTPSEYNYVTIVNVKCEAQNIDLTSAANITPGGEGYLISNGSASNGFGEKDAQFSGAVNKSNWSGWIRFKKNVKVGIKNRTYFYTFNGKRQ